MNKKVSHTLSKPNALYACSLALAPGLGHFFCGYMAWGFFWSVLFLTQLCLTWVILVNLNAPLNVLLSLPVLMFCWFLQFAHIIYLALREPQPGQSPHPVLAKRIPSFIMGCVFLSISFPLIQNKIIPQNWQSFEIPSESMEPTLIKGDQVLVSIIKTGTPIQRESIIVFHPNNDPEDFYIKRVIGLAGDHIEIIDKILRVNGELNINGSLQFLDDEIYSSKISPRDNYEITLGDDELFVMGDNRDNSKDSRYFGPITYKQVVGVANTLILTRDFQTQNIRWDRFGSHLK